MEKDVDEVGKIARFIKSKIEELDRDVRSIADFFKICNLYNHFMTLFIFKFSQNLANRQKPGCGKGTGVDRSRMSTTV